MATFSHICLGRFWDVITTQLLHIVRSLKRFTFWHYRTGPSDQWGLGCVTNWSNSAFDSSDFSDVTLLYRRDVHSLHYFSHSGKWMHVSVSRFRKHRNKIPSLSGVELATTQAMLFNKKQNCGLQLYLWQQLYFIGFHLCKSEETLERLFRGCGRPWSAGKTSAQEISTNPIKQKLPSPADYKTLCTRLTTYKSSSFSSRNDHSSASQIWIKWIRVRSRDQEFIGKNYCVQLLAGAPLFCLSQGVLWDKSVQPNPRSAP